MSTFSILQFLQKKSSSQHFWVFSFKKFNEIYDLLKQMSKKMSKMLFIKFEKFFILFIKYTKFAYFYFLHGIVSFFCWKLVQSIIITYQLLLKLWKK